MNKKMSIFRLLASHPIFLFKLNKSGFGECYDKEVLSICYKMGNLKIKKPVFSRVCRALISTFLLIPTQYSP